MEHLYIAANEHEGLRLDALIPILCPSITRNAAQKMILDGMITVDGKTAVKKLSVKPGQEIRILENDPVLTDIKPQNIGLEIQYEDRDLLVVNKPKGMVVHPAAGNYEGTLVNALLHHCGSELSGINGVIRPGILHRIDKDTSGLLLVAKNNQAHVKLAAQIKNHSFTRIYEAVVYGRIKEKNGKIDAPIGRHPSDRKKMCVTGNHSRNAVTFYEVIEQLNGYCYIQCRLETGRTHQIRVHMSYIGHPVVGDPVYGPKKDKTGIKGQLLFAKTIGFIHPQTTEYMEFSAQTPQEMRTFVEKNK
ncbi:Ribosomal large subunit pseudouridine synthase D [bioreactor metagenome]|uniref:Ribosomal large subunit pseudouridine synthase D n=1 Tax=bioreactor metagenome TaxID=1076179 RepID=A0A645AQ31_9ZZZZ